MNAFKLFVLIEVCLLIVALQWIAFGKAFIIFYPITLGGIMLNRYTLFMLFWVAFGLLLIATLAYVASYGDVLWLGILCMIAATYFCGRAAYHCYRKWLFTEFKHTPH